MSVDVLSKIAKEKRYLKSKRAIKREATRRERIKQKRLQHAEEESQKIKTKILTVLAVKENLTFTQLLKETKYSRQTLSKYLTKLKKEGIILKTFHENRLKYSLRKIPPDIQFVPLVTQFLVQDLKANGVESFNSKLGSLITFLINENKDRLIEPLIDNIKFHIRFIKQQIAETKIGEPERWETEEWKIWKDALESSYIQEKRFTENGLTYKREILTPTEFAKKWLKREDSREKEIQ